VTRIQLTSAQGNFKVIQIGRREQGSPSARKMVANMQVAHFSP